MSSLGPPGSCCLRRPAGRHAGGDAQFGFLFELSESLDFPQYVAEPPTCSLWKLETGFRQMNGGRREFQDLYWERRRELASAFSIPWRVLSEWFAPAR